MIKNSIALALATTALGLTGLANAAEYEVTVTNLTSGVYFTPVIASAHSPDVAMFTLATEASPQMQAIAEGGDVSSMAELLESIGAGVGTSEGLLAPGTTTTITVNSNDANAVLSITAMLLPTNDGFMGVNSVALPSSMGVTSRFIARSYDAGTEANDEIVGSGASGEPGFPNPPPVAASGTGTGGTGVPATAEGFVSIHRGVLGDLDPNGGHSDINAAVHTWSDPVASVTVRMIGGGDDSTSGPSAVAALSGLVYSSSAVEIFWEPAVSANSTIASYEVTRNGELVANIDGLSFYEPGLSAATEFTYSVRAVDANGDAGVAQSVVLRTNAN